MSKKETIEDRVKELEEREEKIKLQIDADSEQMKDKAIRIGKIALISGVVAILGYWVYNLIFSDDEEEADQKTEKKEKTGNGALSRLSALAMPYLEKMVDGVISEKSEEEVDVKE